MAFEVGAQAADGFHDQRQVLIGGDAQAAGEAGFEAGVVQAGLDLRPAAEGDHKFDAEAAEQGNVVDDVDEVAVFDGVTGHGEDDGAAAVGVDVRRGVAKSVQPVV